MRRILLVAAAVGLIACGQSTPEEKLSKALDPAISWSATLAMTGEKWITNSVPASFVDDTVAAGKKALTKSAKAVQYSGADPQMTKAALTEIQRQQDMATAMSKALELPDGRRSLPGTVVALHRSHDVLLTIRDKVEKISR